MYLNTKSKALFLLSIIWYLATPNTMAQGCVDTIVSKKFNVENFGGTFGGGGYQDNYDNFYLMGSIRPAIMKSSFVKFNSQKKLVWSKSYYSPAGGDPFAYFRRFFGVDNQQNLYYSSSGFAASQFIHFLKLDSSGNILNNKLVRVTNTVFGYFTGTINTGEIFSTIINSYLSTTGKDAHFVGTDKNFSSVRWSKVYKPAFTNFIIANGNSCIEIDDTTAIISTFLNYKNPTNLSDTIYTFHLLKINALTGNIIQQKAYSVFDQQNPTKSFFASPLVRNINYANKQIIYQFRKPTIAGDVYSFFTIDNNLSIINIANYLTNTVFGTSNYNSISRSEIMLSGSITQNSTTKLATINWNRNLQLTKQKTYYSSQFTVNAFYTNLAYKNTNNTFSYFVPANNWFSPTSNPIYLFDNTKNPNFEFDCSDKDAELFQSSPAYIFRSDTSTFISQPGFNYQLIDNPDTYTAQTNNFSEETYCDLVSICTSIKIQGKPSFCLNNGNIDSFKIVRNNSCLRRTIFTVDNSQMQILQSNDSLVKVKFLQPFKGYIKAAYENCTIADSMYIEVDTVYNIKTGVYLGADTLQCIGKSIILQAGSGFKKYEWQDGSILSTYTTADTGLFHVKVVDSCNTVFADTVYVYPNPKKLNIAYNNPLCEYDTAKIILPAGLTNYNWQPLASSLKTGNILLLFPTGTSIYIINAQSHNNCLIEDTVLIKKKDCYGSLYFPTAFTPNNDGINDNYKPKAVGILQSYSFTIYNRYGNIVFHTNEINEGWNGRYKNKIQTGGYTWVCTYTFRSRKSETESGSFVLIQ